MDQDGKKAAIAAWKERKTAAGIFALRCLASDELWIGQTANLDKIENRLRFTLTHGGNPNAALQASWTRHGGGAFVLEILEQIDGDEPPYAAKALLKERLAHWRQRLAAATL